MPSSEVIVLCRLAAPQTSANAGIAKDRRQKVDGLFVVGVRGLEPRASCSQTYPENFFRSFIAVFSYFCSVLVTLWHSLKGLFPGVPGLSVVIYVVNNASRPVPGELSQEPDGKRFSFQVVCIVTLRRRLCKWFLRGAQIEVCGAINKEIKHFSPLL